MADNTQLIVTERNNPQVIATERNNQVVVQTKHTAVIVTGMMGPPGAAGATTIGEMTDVNTTNLTAGSILKYDDATDKWVTTLHTLEAVSNVDTTTLTDGSLLIYNTTEQKWVAGTTLQNQSIECGYY